MQLKEKIRTLSQFERTTTGMKQLIVLTGLILHVGYLTMYNNCGVRINLRFGNSFKEINSKKY